MLRPNENKNAPQGNVAQGRGGVVGRKTGGRWSELPISDEELVRRYQAGAGVKALEGTVVLPGAVLKRLMEVLPLC